MSKTHSDSAQRVTLLGPKSDLRGDFSTEEELVILGQVSGRQIEAPIITIGPAARVKATIHTRSIRIEGVVTGDIHAEVAVIVQASATVNGTIHCPNITMREGATINGAANVTAHRDKAEHPRTSHAPAVATRRGR
jgi:cytoskeletal protein CcmA (bactofilin family)